MEDLSTKGSIAVVVLQISSLLSQHALSNMMIMMMSMMRMMMMMIVMIAMMMLMMVMMMKFKMVMVKNASWHPYPNSHNVPIVAT